MQAQQKHGARTLNFGSVTGVVGYPFGSSLTARRAAIIHLTEERRQRGERRQQVMRINAISPGWVIKTNAMMANLILVQRQERRLRQTPTKNVSRLGRWAVRARRRRSQMSRPFYLLRGKLPMPTRELPWSTWRHDAG
ncbi:MAG: hypothetical protein ACLS3C_10760 [Oscillospiraceae bacterium]